jgi:hypothetical protein
MPAMSIRSRGSTRPSVTSVRAAAGIAMFLLRSSALAHDLRAAMSARTADSYDAAPRGAMARMEMPAFPEPKPAMAAGA